MVGSIEAPEVKVKRLVMEDVEARTVGEWDVEAGLSMLFSGKVGLFLPKVDEVIVVLVMMGDKVGFNVTTLVFSAFISAFLQGP